MSKFSIVKGSMQSRCVSLCGILMDKLVEISKLQYIPCRYSVMMEVTDKTGNLCLKYICA